MSHIYRQLPPPGTKIGIAFSGGLDTRAAVAWLTREGLKVHAYTADLAQPDVENPAEIPPLAIRYGAVAADLVDCKQALCREGIIAIQCGAFHLSTAGKTYFNTTPLGRAVTTTAIVQRMARDGVSVFSDGSTYKGNDIQRFYRYGLMVNPSLMIYKPWLDQAFVNAFGGRAEMSQYLEKIGLPYTASEEKAYSTDANLLGSTHEAKSLEELGVSMQVVDPLMGIAPWRAESSIKPERVRVIFERGFPIQTGDEKSPDLLTHFRAANRIGGRHGLGVSDQIENRVIAAKSRGIYEAPGMALFHIVYERLLSAICNEDTIELYQTLGRKLGRLLYAGKWYDPEATAIKLALARIATSVSGTVELELRRGDDYTILQTDSPAATYAPEKLSMEKVQSAFSPEDRIGALEVQTIGIGDSRIVAEKMLPGDTDYIHAWMRDHV